MKKIFYLSFMLISLVSCSLFIPGSGDEPWTETFLSTIDADGENLQHLVEDVFGRPKFSHDGEKIIISNSQGFWIVNTDGSNYTCILDSLNASYDYFSVSPEEENFIFSNSGNIYKLNYITNLIEKVFAYEEESAWYPSYSPDGSKIVFSTTSIGQGDSTIVKLYTMNDDGSNQNLLYQHNSSVYGVIRFPTYSENQEKILFNNSIIGGVQICNSDGSEVNTIFDDCNYIKNVSSAVSYFIYSCSYNIYTYNYDTGAHTNLNEGQMPDISPDGTQITFYDYDLYVMNIDGSNRTKIANSSNIYQSFSFDGEKIVFIGEIQHSSKRDKNPME